MLAAQPAALSLIFMDFTSFHRMSSISLDSRGPRFGDELRRLLPDAVPKEFFARFQLVAIIVSLIHRCWRLGWAAAGLGWLAGWMAGWLAAGCWQLAAGCWLLAAGCLMLAAGCWGMRTTSDALELGGARWIINAQGEMGKHKAKQNAWELREKP